MPMVIARADSFGLTGNESVEHLNGNTEFFSTMEQIRIEAGDLMGMGDVTQSVTPGFAFWRSSNNRAHYLSIFYALENPSITSGHR